MQLQRLTTGWQSQYTFHRDGVLRHMRAFEEEDLGPKTIYETALIIPVQTNKQTNK